MRTPTRSTDGAAGSLRRSSRFARLAAAGLAAALLSGCQALLPDASSETRVEWKSFEDARRTIESFVPYHTRKAEIEAKGIDPFVNPAVSLLSFSDILQRFGASSAIRPEDFDPGVRECLTSGKRCTGYAIQARRIHRERVGNFWLDSLNFRREVDVTGWSFSALVILVDDLVVYTLYSGQPNIREKERSRNPLGPLQGWGEQVPVLLR